MARWLPSLLLVLAACKDRPSKLAAPAPDAIGVADTAIVLDGELAEPAWNARAARGVFLGPDGKLARPYSEIRLLADADTLYVALYAADEDIEASDAFELQLGALAVSVHADGAVVPQLRAAIDRDGTLDQPKDDDEEWVVELAVPRAQLGDGPLAITAKRCDTPKDGVPRCGQWARTLALPRR
jgi:hypothetical protein